MGWTIGLPGVGHCLVMGWTSFFKTAPLADGTLFCHERDLALQRVGALVCQVCVTALSWVGLLVLNSLLVGGAWFCHGWDIVL